MPMQDFIGSVRRSLVFKPSSDDLGGFVEKIGSSIRNSRIGLFTRTPSNALTLPPMEDKSEGEPRVTSSSKVREEVAPLPQKINWKKGELIGSGAFGRVYMGMNCDSGELLAVKEVAVKTNASSRKTQEYIQELEKEVNLLKNLSHPNIVRYLGTVREEDSLNILLEFVPGGSIASLLGNFGSFPESVIKMYTKQLLLGLEYLHKNKIMHRDIKGANILVDNNGCIKLADFGASKKVEALATVTGAKSMKGTPYWMAPEVIVQSGHSYPADIWSVGCTVIEMATGKAPWSQQYQEVAAALFHVGTTKAHPPIPDHLSADAKDFLLKCLQKEPDLRPTTSELLEHPFVTGECRKSHVLRSSPMLDSSGKRMATGSADTKSSMITDARMSFNGVNDVGELTGASCSTKHPKRFSEYESLWKPGSFDDDDMCRIDDDFDLMLGASMKFTPTNSPSIKSFNSMAEPKGDSSCKFDKSPELNRSGAELFPGSIDQSEVDGDFTFPSEQSGPEDDDEVTESKIRAFIVEKALEFKKLQTPLYEFYNSLNLAVTPSPVGLGNKENVASNCNLPPKSSKSPNRGLSRRLSTAIDAEHSPSPGSYMRRMSNAGDVNLKSSQDVREILLDSQRDPLTPRFTEIQKKWKEELAEELQRSRELLRQSGAVKTSSPKDLLMNKHKERFKFASPGK